MRQVIRQRFQAERETIAARTPPAETETLAADSAGAGP